MQNKINVTRFMLWLLGGLLCLPWMAHASLPDTVARIKSSVVGIGAYQLIDRRAELSATGFVVGDGKHVVTNLHVIPDEEESDLRQQLVVFVGQGSSPDVRKAKLVAQDTARDLALLRIEGRAVAPMILAPQSKIREAESVAFTGFPTGAVLGLYPATHRGIIANISPVATPVLRAKSLDPATIRKLRQPFNILQLDAIAYPGNSGSPVYLPDTGEVVGVIQSSFVKQTREAMLQSPSGITYAIPVQFVVALLKQANVPLR